VKFFVGIGLAIIGSALFVFGLLQWGSLPWAVFGFLLGLIGMIVLRSE
jgi:hypothetical protein